MKTREEAREIIKSSGLFQKKIAKDLKMTEVHLSNYLRGITPLSQKKLIPFMNYVKKLEER